MPNIVRANRPSLPVRMWSALRALGRALTWPVRAAKGALTKPVNVAPIGPMLLGRGRIGGDLGPQDVSNILLMADQGYQHALVDLFDESRQKDAHLHAVCANYELGISTMEIQVVPASTKRGDRKVAAFVEDMLANFGADATTAQLDLVSLIEHLARGTWYDHSVAEMLWMWRDQRLVPVAAEPIHARRFSRSAADGKLRFWDECGSVMWPGIDLQEAFPNRYIQHEPRVTGGGPNREGLDVLLVWAALFRNWTMRDWLMLGELAWKPWRIGKYKKEALAAANNAAGKRDIDALQNILENLVSTGSAMIPDTVELDIKYPVQSGGAGDKSPHLTLATFLADEMSKAVLGSTLTVQQGRTGAMALGEVHEAGTQRRLASGARGIAATIRRDMVGPAVRLNFGETAKVPGIRLVSSVALDPTTLSTAVKALVDAGVPIAIPWILKQLGAPMPKVGDPVVGNPTPAIVPPDMPQKKPTPPKRRPTVRVVDPHQLAA